MRSVRTELDQERRGLAQREQELWAEAASVEAAAAAAEQVASRQREEEVASRQREEEEVARALASRLEQREEAEEDRFRQELAEREQAFRQREEQRRAAEQVFRTWFRAINHAREDKWEDLADLLRPVSPRRRKEIMLGPLDEEDSAVGCGQREVRVGSG